MNVSLMELYNFLTTKSNNMTEYLNSVKMIKKLDTKMYSDYGFNVTNFSYDDTLNNIFFSLLYMNIISGYNDGILAEYDIFDRRIVKMDDKIIINVREELLDHLNDDRYNYPFNKKKIIQLITSNQYNHELLLILADRYDINIFIFYKDINIFKVYYSDDKFDTNKKNIFLQYNSDTYSSSNTFQILYKSEINNSKNQNNSNKYIFEWSEIGQMIKENILNIYPIGIEDNKSFMIEEDVINKKSGSKFVSMTNEDSVIISKYIMEPGKINDIEFHNKIVSNKF